MSSCYKMDATSLSPLNLHVVITPKILPTSTMISWLFDPKAKAD